MRSVTQAKLQTQRNARGFTLIELMIVVAIVAILARIAFPATPTTSRGARARCDLQPSCDAGQDGAVFPGQPYAISIPAGVCGVDSATRSLEQVLHLFLFRTATRPDVLNRTATGKGSMSAFVYTVDIPLRQVATFKRRLLPPARLVH